MASNADEAEIVDPPAKYTSKVWKHFGFPKGGDGMQTICKICRHGVGYTSKNTSNMSTHLKRKHGIDIASKATTTSSPVEPLEQGTSKSTLSTERASSDGQLSIAQAFQTKLSAGSARAKMITRSIALYLATEMRPFSTMDSKGFRNMVNCLEPKYTIPSRATITQKEITSLYAEVKQDLQSNLTLAQTVAITADGWTSRATESFVTITVHFIDQSWKAHENVLQTRPLHESHTGANIADVLKGAVQEWDLDRPHGFNPICTDGAANMAVAAQLAEMHPHIKCFAHTINLAAQQALKINEVQRLLGKIRKVVAFFHKSTTATHQLKLKQELLQLPSHKLIIDVKTRWNSAYDMIERYLEQQVAILAALTAPEVHRDKDLDTLSPTDISNAEQLILILRPLKTITTVLCDTKQPTISMVFPLLLNLKTTMAVDPTDSSMMKNFKNALLSDLNKRYTDPALKEFMLQASFIDPRFKMLPFLEPLERISIHTSIITLTDSIYNSSAQHTVKVKMEPGEQPQHDTDPPLPVLNPDAAIEVEPKDEPAAKKSALDTLFGDVFVTQVDPPSKTQIQLIEEEVSKYRAAEPVNINENPLSWWFIHQFEYPFLSNTAKHLLCIPATSVPSERVFSTAGDVVTAQRAALSPENVDILVFLKKNIVL